MSKELFPNMNNPGEELKRIRKQFSEDVCRKNRYHHLMNPICKNTPPEITNLMNACLGCPLRETCKLLFCK